MIKLKTILKKNLIAIISIAVILAGTGTVYGSLNAQEEDFGANTVSGENPNKTQVLLEGKGYSLTKEQKQKYDLPQKVEQKKPNEMKPYDPSSRRPGSPSHYNPHKPGNNTKNAPIIKTNLQNKTMTAGDKLTFWVEGKTFAKSGITTKHYVVKLGKNTLKMDDSSSATHAVYNTNKIQVGKNTITIKVTDPLRKLSTTKTFTVTGKKKEAQQYTVTANFSAPEVYYADQTEQGFSVKVTCECEEGTGSEEIINAINVQLESKGFTAEWEGTQIISLALPKDAYILVPEDEDNPGGETEYVKVTSRQLDGEAFDGAFEWTTDGIPETLTKNATVTSVYETIDY